MGDQHRSALANFITAVLITAVAILSVEVISLFSSSLLFWPTILLAVIVWSVSIGGFFAGFASTVLSLVYAWYYFCNPSHSFCYTPDQLLQFAPLIASMPLILFTVSVLQRRAEKRFEVSRRQVDDEIQRRIQHYESTIKASEQRLRTFLEHSQEGISILDEHGQILFESPSSINILGYTPDEMQRTSGFTHVHPDDLSHSARLLGDILTMPGKTLGTEIRMQHKDGRWLWIAATATNLLTDPSVHGIVVNYRNITDRKNYEQKIRASEEKYRTLFALAPDVVYSIDGQGRLDSLSPSFETATSYKVEEWIGRPFLDIVHPDDRQRALEIFRSRLAGEMSTYELRIIGKDGHIIPIESRSRPRVEGGKILGSIGIARDVTERKQADESLRARTVELTLEKMRAEEEKAKVETIISSIGDAVFAVDENGRIILMNSAAEKLSGYSFSEAVGKYYSHIFQFATEDNSQAAYPDFIKEVIQTGAEKTLASRSLLIRRDGTQLPISDVAAPFRDEQGNILGAVAAFHDNTKERLLERAKDEFISVASHQLRTPLGSMRWTLEMLLQNSAVSGEVHQAMEQLYENNKRMITLVNDLLNVSRIDQGRIPEKSQFVDPAKIVADTLEQVRELAQKHQVTLNFIPPAEAAEIWFDPDRFHEIVENLVSNAVKYNHPGGKVDIRLERHGENLRLTVADNGVGIPEKEQSRVFQKFFRAANAVQSDTEGSGLGLFVVKSYVEKWGGTIWFESREGVGTQFHVDLPIRSRDTGEEKKTYV